MVGSPQVTLATSVGVFAAFLASVWLVMHLVTWVDAGLPRNSLPREHLATRRDDGASTLQSDDFRVAASAEALAHVRAAGGMVFVWPHTTRSCRLCLTMLRASCEPPPGALEFRRVDAGAFLAFIHPAIRRLPNELEIEVCGRRHRRLAVYWDGLAYVA
jgi:hypothetical protein